MHPFDRSLKALPLVQELGRTRFPAIFGGASTGTVEGALEVYWTEEDADARRAFRTVFTGPIQYYRTGRSEVDQRALHEEVTARAAGLLRVGIELSYFGPKPRTGIERIGVPNLTESKRLRLIEEFGPWVEPYNMTGRPILARGTLPARHRDEQLAPWKEKRQRRRRRQPRQADGDAERES